MNAVVPLPPRSLLEHELRRIRPEVDRLLAELLDSPLNCNARLNEALRFAALGGGKRIRPLLTVAAAQVFGVPRADALYSALAAECVHVQSLIHDDLPCMDDGQVRRGKPTVHRAFDEATAVVAGDALLTLAFQVLSDERAHPEPAVRAELIQELAFAIGPSGMAAGQMFDLDGAGDQPAIADVMRTQYLKTGALFCWSVNAGAVLGRAPTSSRNALRSYAYCLGQAFQIADDVLDAEGGELCGKDVGKDAAKGRGTLISLLGLDAARERAQTLAAQARHYVRPFGANAQLLMDIADFSVRRER